MEDFETSNHWTKYQSFFPMCTERVCWLFTISGIFMTHVDLAWRTHYITGWRTNWAINPSNRPVDWEMMMLLSTLGNLDMISLWILFFTFSWEWKTMLIWNSRETHFALTHSEFQFSKGRCTFWNIDGCLGNYLWRLGPVWNVFLLPLLMIFFSSMLVYNAVMLYDLSNLGVKISLYNL